jgi:DNA-binding NarL/FixJ family response regulator
LALDNLAHPLAAQGQPLLARTMVEEEIAIYQELGDRWGLAMAIVTLGCISAQMHDLATAQQLFTQALALRRTEADKWNIAETLSLLGEVLMRRAEFAAAAAVFGECLVLAREIGSQAAVAHTLHQLGVLAQMRGDCGHAVCLFAAAAPLRRAAGGVAYHTLVIAPDEERAIAAARSHLPAADFETRWVEGASLTVEQAVSCALAWAIPSTSAQPTNHDTSVPKHSTGLTTREIEVLGLLVQGMTYAQIADKLVISSRTVNAHLTTIYSKLGATSRAEAAQVAMQQRLVESTALRHLD